MDAIALFRRSPMGQAALDQRDKRIPARMRALMLMAEGKPMDQFDELASALGAPADSLEKLVSQGFVVARVTAPEEVSQVALDAPEAPRANTFQQFRTVSGLMREITADMMGIKGFFFILKIEKCSVLPDLVAILPDLIEAVAKRRGRQNADKLERQIRAMLG